MKQMQNRFLSFSLALAMLLSCALMLAGCGSKDDDDDDDDRSKASGSWEDAVEKPIRQLEDEDLDLKGYFVNLYDGLGKDQLSTIYRIASSSDNFTGYDDDRGFEHFQSRQDMEDHYGEDWDCTLQIVDKDDLDEDDLEEIKEIFAESGDRLIELADTILESDSDDLRQLADDMGLKKEDLKKLANEIQALGNLLMQAEPKKGYEVDMEITFSGSENEESGNKTTQVVLVDGCWVLVNSLYSNEIFVLLEDLGYSL